MVSESGIESPEKGMVVEMSDKAEFLASLPASKTAIQIHGSGRGMQIILSIPESQLGEAYKLLNWRDQVLQVAIEPQEYTGAVEEALVGSTRTYY